MKYSLLQRIREKPPFQKTSGETEQEGSDPILESGMAAITQAMVNFDTVTVGWKVDDRYNLLSYEVGRLWDRQGPDLRRGAVTDLREALAADPKLHVVIMQGWNDLSCPFMGSVLTQNQLPATIAPQLSGVSNQRMGVPVVPLV